MGFNHLRVADLGRLREEGDGRRSSQSLLDAQSGAQHMSVKLIRTPPDAGSREGTHSHRFEQVFYVVRGEMSVDVDGEEFALPSGSLFVIPAGMPHRTWNATSDEVLHLSINAPL